MKITSVSEAQTEKLGRNMAKQLVGGEVITLSGDLGAGKTVFVKGLAKGLGIKQVIVSPTFLLMKVYRTKGKIKHLVHVDTYRVQNEQDLREIGLADYLGHPDTVTVIEWPQKLRNLLSKKPVILVHIEHDLKDPKKREIN